METYNPLCRFTVTDEKLDLIIEKYELLRSTNIIDFNAFAGLADRHDTNIVMMNYQNLGSDFYNFHISCKHQLKKHSDVEAEYKIKHKDLTKACNNLVYNLKNYIILK